MSSEHLRELLAQVENGELSDADLERVAAGKGPARAAANTTEGVVRGAANLSAATIGTATGIALSPITGNYYW